MAWMADGEGSWVIRQWRTWRGGPREVQGVAKDRGWEEETNSDKVQSVVRPIKKEVKHRSLKKNPLKNLTSAAIKILKDIGTYPDIKKAKDSRQIRYDKGKMRNRHYISRKGPLIVYGTEGSKLVKAFRCIHGAHRRGQGGGGQTCRWRGGKRRVGRGEGG